MQQIKNGLIKDRNYLYAPSLRLLSVWPLSVLSTWYHTNPHGGAAPYRSQSTLHINVHIKSLGDGFTASVGNIRYEGNNLFIVYSSRKEKKTRERRSGKENQRKQGCDCVSLVCASPHY